MRSNMSALALDYASMARRQRIRPKSPPSVYLKAWLDESGLTQDQLAERIGAHQATVSKYMSGKTALSMQAAIAIADALGIRDVDLYRHPNDPSLDALMAGASPEDRARAVRVLKAMREEGAG